MASDEGPSGRERGSGRAATEPGSGRRLKSKRFVSHQPTRLVAAERRRRDPGPRGEVRSEGSRTRTLWRRTRRSACGPPRSTGLASNSPPIYLANRGADQRGSGPLALARQRSRLISGWTFVGARARATRRIAPWQRHLKPTSNPSTLHGCSGAVARLSEARSSPPERVWPAQQSDGRFPLMG